MTTRAPNLIVLAGPNGAGKSTTAPFFLRDELAVHEFVNADVIAQGLSAFGAEGVAVAAGRILLQRLTELVDRRADLAFESTLASRTLAGRLRDARTAGYRLHVLFLWLADAELAVARVQQRVDSGGHSVPTETVRRRYRRGIDNFFRIYKPLADRWRFYDNSDTPPPVLIAKGGSAEDDAIVDAARWRRARSGS